LREVAGDLQIAMVLLRTRRPARAGTFRLWCALLVCNSAGLLLSPLHTASVPARASSPCLFGGGSSAKPSKASRQKAAKPSTKRPAAAAGEAKKKPWEASEDVVKQREAILKVFKSGAAVARARKAEREEAEQDAPALRFGGRAQPPASPPPPAAKRLESQGVNQRKERLLAERSKLQAEVGAAEAAASGGFELGEFASMCAELIAAKAQLAVQQQVDGLVRSANEAAEAIAAAPAAAAAAATAEAGKAQAKLTASMDEAVGSIAAAPAKTQAKLAASIDEAVGSIAAAPAKTQAKLAASIEAAASEIQELPNKVSNTVKGELEAAQQKAEAQLEKAKSSIPRKP
jgi:hypothetical protein